MTNQDILNILRSIQTVQQDKKDRDIPKEIMFSYEGRDYSAEEVASLISMIDAENIEDMDIDFIKTLSQNLSSDNRGENRFSNEEVLVGPLLKKIDEIEILKQKQEFKSNQEELEKIKAANSNLGMIDMIKVRDYESDSHYNLDYLTITKPDGTLEMVSVPDPDYLQRFDMEYSDQVAQMDANQFINTVKSSADGALDFVKLDEYLSNRDLQNKMPSPANKDRNLMAAELQEVTRLANLHAPNEDIYITIDRYGEVFYRVKNGIFKGHTYNGERKVECLNGSVFGLNNTNKNEEKNNEYKEVSSNENRGDNVQSNVSDVNIVFDPNKFKNEFRFMDEILNGADEARKTEFLNQVSALFDLWYTDREHVSDELVACLATYYNRRKDYANNALGSDSLQSGQVFNLQELNLMQKIYFAADNNPELSEQVKGEMQQSDIHGDTKFHEKEETHAKVLTFKKNNNRYNNRQAAFSMIAIILEIISVALLVLMFLSLDI